MRPADELGERGAVFRVAGLTAPPPIGAGHMQRPVAGRPEEKFQRVHTEPATLVGHGKNFRSLAGEARLRPGRRTRADADLPELVAHLKDRRLLGPHGFSLDNRHLHAAAHSHGRRRHRLFVRLHAARGQLELVVEHRFAVGEVVFGCHLHAQRSGGGRGVANPEPDGHRLGSAVENLVGGDIRHQHRFGQLWATAMERADLFRRERAVEKEQPAQERIGHPVLAVAGAEDGGVLQRGREGNLFRGVDLAAVEVRLQPALLPPFPDHGHVVPCVGHEAGEANLRRLAVVRPVLPVKVGGERRHAPFEEQPPGGRRAAEIVRKHKPIGRLRCLEP